MCVTAKSDAQCPLRVINCRAAYKPSCPVFPGEFNRSTQHPSLERTDCWCRSNFSIKSQDIRHRSRSFERLRRYPPILAALPALSALCLQLRHEPCPCMSLHMHAIPTWRIRVKGCCVDRLSPPPKSCRDNRRPGRQLRAIMRQSAPQQNSPYSITKSARESIFGGISSPIARAS